MKIKRFNIENTKCVKIGKPTIRFAKQGQITLSTEAVRKMNIKPGDKIEFIQDEEKPKDWYLKKSKIGFSTRKYSGSDALICNASTICRLFMISVEKEGALSVGCFVATVPTSIEGEEMYAILTKSIFK